MFDQAGYRVRFVFYVHMQGLVFFEKTFLDPLLVHAFQILGQRSDFLQVLLDFLLQIYVYWWKVRGAQERANRFDFGAVV